MMEQQASEVQAGLSGILHWNLVHDSTADDAEAASHIVLWDQPATAPQNGRHWHGLRVCDQDHATSPSDEPPTEPTPQNGHHETF